MALADEKTRVEEVSTPPVADDEARPRITFKTKMAIFVCALTPHQLKHATDISEVPHHDV
jgi:hypothetical protein